MQQMYEQNLCLNHVYGTNQLGFIGPTNHSACRYRTMFPIRTCVNGSIPCPFYETEILRKMHAQGISSVYHKLQPLEELLLLAVGGFLLWKSQKFGVYSSAHLSLLRSSCKAMNVT